jgi:hypothetical protein
MDSNLHISNDVKEQIVRKHIEPNYIHEISKLIQGKKNWKLIGQIFETSSKALVAIGGIVSFAAGSYNNFHLSFIAGAISTISLATLSFSSFGYKEQKKQGLELNNLLKKLKIEEVPINERNVDDFYQAASMRQSVPSQNNINYQLDRANHVINEQAQEINELEKRLIYERAKQKPYANDLKLLKEKLNEVLSKPPLSRVNTPIEDREWLKFRITQLEEQNQIELKVND